MFDPDPDDLPPRRRERAAMPTSSDAKRKAASKKTRASRKVSHSILKAKGSISGRRLKRWR